MEETERISKLKNSADSNLFDYLTNNRPCGDGDAIMSFFSIRTTFGRFKARVTEIAKKLAGCGLKKGDRVTISIVSSPESVELLYACSYLGIVPVLADLRLSEAEMKELCEETGSKLVFISDFRGCELFGVSEVPCVEKVVIVSLCDGISYSLYSLQKIEYLLKNNPFFIKKHFVDKVCEWRQFMAPSARNGEPIPAENGDGELLFATSGTTGRRKYVILTAKQLNLAACQHIIRFDYSEVRTTLSVMPLFACYGFVTSVHLPLLAGTTLILHPVYESDSLPRILLKYKPNAFAGVISQWEELVAFKKAADEDFSYLKIIMFGGDFCPRQKLDAINAFLSSHGCKTKLCQGYGMTEVASGAVLQDPERFVPDSVGCPLPFVRICITEPGTVDPLPAGSTGEICIHTPCQTKGYFNDPDATNELIRRHGDGLDWIHSGDLGHIENENDLCFDGRIKGMVVSSSGTKLFLPRLKERAEQAAGGKCAVVALPDSTREYIMRIVLFVSPAPGLARLPRKRRLLSELKETLPMYLIPEKIVYLKSLPLTSSGKTDMQALKKRAARIIGGKTHVVRKKLK